jgi:hypothetical protein
VRVTLSIDDDVLHAVRERASREQRTAGEVLTALARESLTGPRRATGSSPAAPRANRGFRPLPRRGPVVTRAMVDRLRGDT